MAIKDHDLTADVIQMVKKMKNMEYAVATDFGVAAISRKEVLHLLETCELDIIYFSFSGPGLFILERGEEKPGAKKLVTP